MGHLLCGQGQPSLPLHPPSPNTANGLPLRPKTHVYSGEYGGPTYKYINGANPTDGQWHRLTLSGKTLYVDGVVAAQNVSNFLSKFPELWLGWHPSQFRCCGMNGEIALKSVKLWGQGPLCASFGAFPPFFFSWFCLPTVAKKKCQYIWHFPSSIFPKGTGIPLEHYRCSTSFHATCYQLLFEDTPLLLW